MSFRKSKRGIYLTATILLFVAVFGLISFVNHAMFRTHALDLGVFNQAIYSYSVLHPAQFTQSVDGSAVSYLGDHFSLIVLLLAPFRYILGTYTLLFFQIVAIALGGYYAYLIAMKRGYSAQLSMMVLLFAFSCWTIYSALSYDFHANVIAASLCFPLVFYLETDRRWWITLFFVLILICKENSSLVLSFLLISWVVDQRLRSGRWSKLGMVLSATAMIYFFLVVLWIMPAINHANEIASVRSHYGYLGGSMSEVLRSLVSSPVTFLKHLMLDADGEVAPTKLTSLRFILYSGGLFLLIRPHFLIALVPVIAQKFLSENEIMWDIHKQYSIEFWPILVLVLISGVSYFSARRIKSILLFLSVLIAGYWSVREVVLKSTEANFLSREHYQPLFNPAEVRRIVESVPDAASIAVISNLSPHVSFRKEVMLLPNIGNAAYLIMDQKTLREIFFNSPEGEYFIPREPSLAHLQFRMHVQYKHLLVLTR